MPRAAPDRKRLLNRGEESGELGPELEIEGFFQKFIAIDFARFLKVLREHARDLVDVFLRGENGGDFEVEPEGAVVEIAGPDARDLVVDEEGLLMHEAIAVAKEADVIGEGLAVVSEGGQPNENLVRFFGEKNADIDAAQGRRLEAGQDAVIRNKVG